MIAKNAVILIVQIEADRAEGMQVWDAVVAASNSRLRPMMLTALSTVLGLIPIAPTVFWGPMAFAIMGGLLVATLLTLVFLPTLYVTWSSAPAAAGAAGGAGAGSMARAIRFAGAFRALAGALRCRRRGGSALRAARGGVGRWASLRLCRPAPAAAAGAPALLARCPRQVVRRRHRRRGARASTRACPCDPASSPMPRRMRARSWPATASAALASLSPGTLPAGLDEDGRLVIHTLDTAQDAARRPGGGPRTLDPWLISSSLAAGLVLLTAMVALAARAARAARRPTG